jgi:hypothetical protein
VVREVYYGCCLDTLDTSRPGDSHDLQELIAAYCSYDQHVNEPGEDPCRSLRGEAAIAALDAEVVARCQAWLDRHLLCNGDP